MFLNYIKTTFRNLYTEKFYSAINIVGLAIGLASAMLIGLYIFDELSFDTHHKNYEQIYRISSKFSISGKKDLTVFTGSKLAPTLQTVYPEIERTVRFIQAGENLFRYEEVEDYESRIYYADSTIFEIFSHKFLQGDPQMALSYPNTIVVTESTAKKYFGNENPLGKTIFRQGDQEFLITGVIEDVPPCSHLQFDFLISMKTIEGWLEQNESFWWLNCFTYIKLKENSTIENLQRTFPDFFEKFMASTGVENSSYNIIIQNISEIHLGQKLSGDLPKGEQENIVIFLGIALFILVIASINYMNLATARASTRAKEVAIRKVVGASRTMLIARFLTESVMVSFLAFFLALGIVETILPFFNFIAEKEITFLYKGSLGMLLIFIAITLVTGIVSGSYPAFYLSSFEPMETLKKKSATGLHSNGLRKILVIFQFTLSIVLLVGMLTISKQLNYIQNFDLGFDKNNIMVTVVRDTTLLSRIEEFKEQLLISDGVSAVAASSSKLPALMVSRTAFEVTTKRGNEKQLMNFIEVDYDYIDLMKMQIVAGRKFQKKFEHEKDSAFIVNETAVKNMGFTPEEAIGKSISIQYDEESVTSRKSGIIVGVVKDFNYSSLHNEIEPIVFFLENNLPLINIRLTDENPEKVVAHIKAIRKKMNLPETFTYTILVKNLLNFYTPEQKLKRIVTYFAFLSMFIACLGLFGLTAFVSERRTKEIGIRKALGATSIQIFFLVIADFIELVFIANIIAWFVAYLIVNEWLSNYAYYSENSIGIFILATLISILIALITISYQAIKIARENPIKALKYE